MMHTVHSSDLRTDFEKWTWAERFVAPDTPRYIFGCNQWGKSVADLLSVTAFVDDFAVGASFAGVPIIKSHAIPADAMVLSVVVVGRPLTVRNHLESIGVSHLDYFSFLRFCQLPIEPIQYLVGAGVEIENHADFYSHFKDQLFDEVSRETYRRVLKFRTELDLEQMVVFTDRQKEQYFEPFVKLHASSVFLDVGAFDGFTSEQFFLRAGKNSVAHVFEPSAVSCAAINQRLERLGNVKSHQFALGAKNDTVCFRVAGSASSIDEDGDELVEIRTLDSLELSVADFVKVDIEGAELEFLLGAEETLRSTRPQLAIAAYHSADHIRRITNQVLEFMPESRVFMRHYTEGFAETDLFFIPERFW
jgi:FkbM family methyltransferase